MTSLVLVSPGLGTILHWLGIFILCYFTFVQLNMLFLLILSFFDMRRRLSQNYYTDFECMAKSRFTFPISILVPAYNEGKTISQCIRSVLALDYPQFEVIVVNDGSTDDTLASLTRDFELVPRDVVYRRVLATRKVRRIYKSETHPSLTVADVDHHGKSNALNVGINLSHYPLFCSIDADSVFQKNALLRVVRPMLENPEEVVAVGGQVRIANGCLVNNGQIAEARLPNTLLPALQVVEYLRAFVASRLGLSKLNCLLILSGVFALFRKDVVVEVGGYHTDNITEDMELVTRIHQRMKKAKRPYGVVFLPDPICWTEVPSDMKTLWRQRNRWHRGLIASMFANIRMLWNPAYGRLGFVSMPYYFFVEMLSPVIELLGYVIIPVAYFLGLLSVEYLILYFFLSIVLGSLLSVAALFLEERSFGLYPRWRDFGAMVLLGIVENFGYRQLTLLMRIHALILSAFRRQENHWGDIARKGFNDVNGNGVNGGLERDRRLVGARSA